MTWGRRLAPFFVGVATACLPSPRPAPGPVLQPEQRALALERRTRPAEPVRAVFDWALRERDLRVSGKGVLRLEPPYRARLDLFSPRGEVLFQAVLVGDELRVPPWAPLDLAPRPPLLWAALGVFRPGAELALLGAEGDAGGSLLLRYAGPEENEEVHFRVDSGSLEEARWLVRGRAVESIRLRRSRDPGGLPDAVYRDLRAFRELSIDVVSVERVESFPADIWRVGGR